MQTFLFYDVETTGLHKPFDQILQFAAIRTDSELKEIARYNILIRLNTDTIPSPEGMIIHQIRLKDLENGVSEYDALQQIHALLNEPGTISLGYNTLQFDDEFLRFSFYRNLLTPYTHQFANQCGRMDIYPMALMYYLFKPEVIRWPTLNDIPTFKLEHINAENQFASGAAHDAMVDVEATLALARCFHKEKKMWDYLQTSFNKKEYQEHIAKLPFSFSSSQQQFREGLLIEGKLGARQFFQSHVIYCGNNQHYNQALWLRLDNEELSRTTPESIEKIGILTGRKPDRSNANIPLVTMKKLDVPGFILPLNDRYTRYLDNERQQIVQKNKRWLEKNPAILLKIIDHYRNFKYPDYPNVDIDAALYMNGNGFWSNADVQACQKFHKASPSQKSKIAEEILNPHLQQLAVRVMGRHFLETTNPSQKKIFDAYLAKTRETAENALIDFAGKKRLTRDIALSSIGNLENSEKLTATQLEILAELKNYLLR